VFQGSGRKDMQDFTERSPLFKKKHIDDDYRFLSDESLRRELALYRECSLQAADRYAARGKRELSVFTDTSGSFLPDEALLKQCALYVENVIIDDPIFRHTAPRNKSVEALNALFGINQGVEVDRRELAHSAAYISRLLPAIQADFVQLLPVSYFHEPPKEIPITYSENLYADALPEALLNWFRSAAEVYPLTKGDRGWYSLPDEPLRPCRAIGVHFRGHPSYLDPVFFLTQLEVLSVDEETGIVETVQTFPDAPPSAEWFITWVYQSVNQAARRFFETVYKEFYFACRVGSTYLTKSPFVANLLGEVWHPGQDLQTDVISAVLQLELPILEGVSLNQIIELRQKDGEAFQNFRVELAKHLRKLRRTTDPRELEIQMQNVSHELSEVQVNEVNKKIASAKRGMFADALILVGGLAATVQTQVGGWGIAALIAYAAEKGLNTYSEYVSQVRENPAFFLWKLGAKQKGRGT
jgi:hypothetical protein